jgi:4-amino-4-deoxy-L-arabinose transferase-like glycosyltransferase
VENSRQTIGTFVLLLAVAIPVFFVFLGANSIWDTNEAFYVETPRQMVRSGNYIDPSFNAAPRFNKPVLSYWIVAGLYRVLGDSVTVERIGIAVGALAIVLAAYLIGLAARSRLTGTLAALIVATSPRVVWFARKIFIDVYLTTFTSLALAAFALAVRYPARRRLWLILMYVALGLGVLTKGPVAVVLPALICGLWLALEGRLGELRRMMIVPGALIVLAIVFPWYVAIYARHGWTYITTFFVDENLRRYASTAMTPGGRGPLFYLPVLLGELFPWAPLVIVPLLAIPRTFTRDPAPRAAEGSLDRLLWIWVVTFVVIFSFSRTKEDLYIFPIVPAVAVLVASTLVGAFSGEKSKLSSPLFLITCGLCVAAGPALYWLFGPSAGFYALPEIRPFAVVMAVTGAAAGGLWLAHRRSGAVVSLAAGFIALNYLFVGQVLQGVERSKPVVPLVRTFEAKAAPGAKVGYYKMALQSFVYYTNRGGIEEIGLPEQAYAFFWDDRESWAIMGVDEWDMLHARISHVCVVERRPLSIFDARLSDIVARRPPEEVLLVKNHCSAQ